MYEESVLTVFVEQPYVGMVEALQETLVIKQGMIERMRQYHLCTVQLEREVEQIQHEIERYVVQ